MSSVVFLRAVNVGGTNRCQPAAIAKQLAKFDVVNIGAVGTFVVRADVSESILRNAFAQEVALQMRNDDCSSARRYQTRVQGSVRTRTLGENITRFVNVLAKRVRTVATLPLSLPSENDWLLKIIAIQNRFVLGFYRRHMKAISYLSKIEKLLGVPATTRSWNTIKRVAEILDNG